MYLEWTDVVVYFKWPDLNFLRQSSFNLLPLSFRIDARLSFEFHILFLWWTTGGPKPNANLQLTATVNTELKWQVPVGVAPPANAPPHLISYLFSPDTLLIWSQLHHLRARVHYNKSVVSCQSCSRCKMEPVWDLSNTIKGPLCKIGLDLWFLHC